MGNGDEERLRVHGNRVEASSSRLHETGDRRRTTVCASDLSQIRAYLAGCMRGDEQTNCAKQHCFPTEDAEKWQLAYPYAFFLWYTSSFIAKFCSSRNVRKSNDAWQRRGKSYHMATTNWWKVLIISVRFISRLKQPWMYVPEDCSNLASPCSLTFESSRGRHAAQNLAPKIISGAHFLFKCRNALLKGWSLLYLYGQDTWKS